MATSKSSTKTPAAKRPATAVAPAKTKASPPAKAEPVAKAKAAPKPAPKAAPKKAAAKQAKVKVATGVPAEQRRNYVEMAAYYIAERRGFAPGNLVDDWVQAEAEIDRLLAEGRLGS